MAPPPNPFGGANDSIPPVVAVESLATLAFDPDTSWYQGAPAGKYPSFTCVAWSPVAPASTLAPAPPSVARPAAPDAPDAPPELAPPAPLDVPGAPPEPPVAPLDVPDPAAELVVVAPEPDAPLVVAPL